MYTSGYMLVKPRIGDSANPSAGAGVDVHEKIYRSEANVICNKGGRVLNLLVAVHRHKQVVQRFHQSRVREDAIA